MLHTFRAGWFIAAQVRSASTDDGGKSGNKSLSLGRLSCSPSTPKHYAYSVNQLDFGQARVRLRSCFGFHGAVGRPLPNSVMLRLVRGRWARHRAPDEERPLPQISCVLSASPI